MHPLLEDAPSLATLNAAIRVAWDALAPSFTGIAKEILIERDRDALELAQSLEAVLLITDGMLTLSHSGLALLSYEEGDLIGLSGTLHTGSTQPSLDQRPIATSSFAVRAHGIPLREIFAAITSSPALIAEWTSLLAAHTEVWRLLTESCATKLSLGSEVAPPRVQHFETGETIIHQGAATDEVFTLVEGTAQAVVDGVKVGEIKADEIFGAIAAIAGVPRTASVVATSRCMAISLPKGDFLHLLKTRPSTVLRLIQDMARALANTNEKVVQKLR